jgi:arylsulfatase A-like enzyme
LADDMGYGDLSCLNEASRIRTTHLDALAGRGMIFRDAHASSAVCTPSRYSILTGRYNWRSWLKQSVLDGYGRPLVDPGRMTVASLLSSQGYHTACVGKWHLGWQWGLRPGQFADPGDAIDFAQPIQGGPCDVGFDHFFGISASLDMPPYVYVEDDKVTALPEAKCPGNDDAKGFWRGGWIAPDFRHEQVLDVLADRACDYIRARAQTSQPFFLYLPLNAPHTPILPGEGFVGQSGTNAYGDFCLHVDDVVGRVRGALVDAGLEEDTILIFTSDNGCSPRADFEELAALGHHPSHVFRGHKADIYEGGHRIPLLVQWPGGISPGAACDETICLSDLLATMADLLGVALPDDAGEDSVSHLPLWLSRPTRSPLREATVQSSIDGSLCIRRRRWKLEMCAGSAGWSWPRPGGQCEGLPPMQLYDLEADVSETRNVAQDHPEVVVELRDLLSRYVLTGRSTPGKAQNNDTGPWWKQLWWLQPPGGQEDLPT